MCAIAGILHFEPDRPIDLPTLVAMRDSMAHRGPDDEGVYVQGPIGIAARRLSIIDLETGNQPVHNEDRSVWAVLNGEIYNFRALRQDLERRGHRFSTHGDTEVLPHAYEEFGPACVEMLKGMFAFAIWDGRERSLFLARDRMGEKPLHYFINEREFVFGSELKSLLGHPSAPRDLDALSLSKYLTFQYVPAPHSIFRGIRKVQPGHAVLLKADRPGVSIERQYWDIPQADTGAGDVSGKPVDAYSEELLRLLRASVQAQLVGDVPVGVFLSGGIDSTLLAALAAESQPRLDTFTIAFDDPTFDESPAARLVADRIGAVHHVEVCRPGAMREAIPDIAGFLDEPLADASILPTYLLSKFAARSIKVALGGDGGDELFAGYPTFQALQWRAGLGALAPAFCRVGRLAADALPVSHAYLSFDFKFRQFLRGADASAAETGFFYWMGAFTETEKAALLNPALQRELAGADSFEDVRRLAASRRSPNEIQRCMYLAAKLYLQDGVLVKVDRAGMANSLEVRAPYLDHDLVEFAARCPLGYQMTLWRLKALLRRAAKDLLPPEILGRPKKGFGPPIARWLVEDLREYCEEYLGPARLRREGLFNPAYVGTLLADHRSMRRNHWKLLWTLLIFQLWKERWLSGAA